MGHLWCLLWHLQCSGSQKSFSSASTECNLLLLVQVVPVVAGERKDGKSCTGQIPCKQLHMPGPPISLSIPFILKMLQKNRDIFTSRIVPCLCLFLSKLSLWNWGLEYMVQWQLSKEMYVVAGLLLLNNHSSQIVIKCQSSWLFWKLITTISA